MDGVRARGKGAGAPGSWTYQARLGWHALGLIGLPLEGRIVDWWTIKKSWLRPFDLKPQAISEALLAAFCTFGSTFGPSQTISEPLEAYCNYAEVGEPAPMVVTRRTRKQFS